MTDSIEHAKILIKKFQDGLQGNKFDWIFEEAKQMCQSINFAMTMSRNALDSKKKKFWLGRKSKKNLVSLEGILLKYIATISN